MNKKLSLAVAGAVLAFGASAANAGIVIPAGDWTVDIGGNVNAYYTKKTTDVTVGGVKSSLDDGQSIGTGLLPAAFGIGAKTRQNDLDIAFQFSFFTGTSAGSSLGAGGNTAGAAGNNNLNIRQAYLTFGDASWGTIKAGRDLGIFGSDAILSDMTLLGVGVSGGTSASGGSSTLGRIGSGYIYADWKGQISYTSPNWNGFSFAVGVLENFQPLGSAGTLKNDNLSFEGKVAYEFAANDFTGKVWLGGVTQKTEAAQGFVLPFGNYTSEGFDIGGKVAYSGAQLVGYYYDGQGLDSQAATFSTTTGTAIGGLFNATGVKTDDKGGYVQGTFVIPGVGTKLGASWGTSKSKFQNFFDFENESWIIGAYHPLTKSLNLVAEYTNNDSKEKISGDKIESDTFALGAILFF